MKQSFIPWKEMKINFKYTSSDYIYFILIGTKTH